MNLRTVLSTLALGVAMLGATADANAFFGLCGGMGCGHSSCCEQSCGCEPSCGCDNGCGRSRCCLLGGFDFEPPQGGRGLVAAGQCCRDEFAEQRVRAIGTTLELGVRLGGHPEGVIGELDELDQPLVG